MKIFHILTEYLLIFTEIYSNEPEEED